MKCNYYLFCSVIPCATLRAPTHSSSSSDLFASGYIAEFLRVLEPEKQITLELIDSDTAAVFRTDEAYTYVIMPLSREQN